STRSIPNNVHFPYPGHPPQRTTDPGTPPPPSTRSSSAIRVSRRSVFGAWTSLSGTGLGASPAPPDAERARPPPARVDGPLASTSVFHSPPPGHRPVHASAECPHSWQTN